jgi:tagatose 1,6-diphosphate aldolase GatY/KbaY
VIVDFAELLAEARAGRGAVGAFTCYDVTTALGVIRAATSRRAGVILLVSTRSVAAPDGHMLVSALATVGAEAAIPCCVELDHTSDPAVIEAAFVAGAGAAMADGSRLENGENTRLVKQVRELARMHSAAVEAELGQIEGGEDVSTAAAAGKLTDPEEAATFVAEAAPDCLAVSIGNVHGAYAAPPQLDWARLADILEHVDGVPLALHGASGLPDGDVRRAVALGICKVNVNTELRERYLDTLAERLPQVREGARLLELQESVVDAVAAVVAAKLDLLEGKGS